MMKKLLSVILTIAMLVVPMAEMTAFAAPEAVTVSDDAAVSVVPSQEEALLAADQGILDNDLTWVLDNGTLTISGEGEMMEFWDNSEVPWYNSRESINHVVFEDGVTSASYGMLYDCQNLETVTFGKDIKEIDSGFIDACNTVKSFAVSSDNEIFYTDKSGVLYKEEYHRVELVKYPGGNERTSYTVPDDVERICSCAFQFSKNLKSVTLGEDVEIIDYRAFSDCPALESFEIPDSVYEIRQYILDNCTSLKTLKIGSGLCEVWENAFDFMPALESITVDADNEYFSSDKDGVLYNKDKTEVIKFPKGKKVTSYSIPDGVVVIGANSFENIETLESVYIPDSVTTIGISAFAWSQKLKTISGAKNVLEIGERAFDFTAYVKDDNNFDNNVLYLGKCLLFAKDFEDGAKCTIKDGTVVIAEGAFSSVEGLVSVVIPDSVKVIGGGAFIFCTDLENITIGDNVEHLGWQAFYDTAFYNDESNWDNNVLYIGNYLVEADYFNGAYTVKDGTVLIADYAFNNEDDLTSVVIPDSVKSIGESAFYYCSQLESVTFGKGLTTIADYAFYDCIALESLTFPDSLVTIGYCAFSSCQKVTDITFGKGLKSIGESAFYYCRALETVVFPDGLESIGPCAFQSCKNLTKATFGPEIKEIGYDAFDNGNDFEIHGYVNTAAQEFANDEGIKFVARAEAGYTVSYNAAGGTGAPDIQQKEKNKTLTLSTQKPTRKGYTFKGWSTIPDGKVEYAPGAKYTENKSLTLYAVWEKEIVAEKKVVLGATKLSMIIGGTSSLTAEVTPENATYKEIVWSSSDENVAVVDENGVITALKSGKAKITATSHNGKKATCTVTVGAPATRVDVTALKTTSLAVGKSITIKAKAACEGKTKPVSTAVVFEIIDGEEYATIDAKGKLTGIATGEVTVRARAEAGTEDAYEDIVISVCNPATKVTLDKTKASMIVGDELQLEATLVANGECTDSLTWSVDKEEIATVDENGVVTALSAGKAKVTALAGSGKKATCTITVGEPATRVDVTALKTTSVAVGKSITIKAKAACEGKTKPVSTAVVFEIIDGEEYATIDAKGKLTGIATGEVTVRVRAEAGTKEAFAEVTVNVCVPATKVTLNMTKATISAGDDLQLKAEMTAKSGECTDTLTWSVDKPEIATVDKNGLVTAISEGKAKITAMSGSGKKATCTVTVEKAQVYTELKELSVKNISYVYVEGDSIIEYNPGAVGGMTIEGEVWGPSEVREVFIAKWGTNISDMTQKEISEVAEWYADIWKKAGIDVEDREMFPLYLGDTHPVDANELHGHLEVLLIGVDKDCNAVAYYIVKQ